MRMGNSQNAKANKVVRELLDEFFKNLPYTETVTSEGVCSLINADDHRRDYSSGRVAALLRERDDLDKTPEGWRKKPKEEVKGECVYA
jgi:hypothetical protein